MRMYSASFEASVQVYIKSKSEDNARGLIAGVRRLHDLNPVSNSTFTNRHFSDPRRRDITINTSLFARGLLPGSELVDLGQTIDPTASSILDIDRNSEGPFRLFSATALVKGQFMLKASTRQRAAKMNSGLMGAVFRFRETADSFFNEPPLSLPGVRQITFGTILKIHSDPAAAPVHSCGACVRWAGDNAAVPYYGRLLHETVERPIANLIQLPFPVSTPCYPNYEVPLDEFAGVRSAQNYVARPLFKGRQLSVFSNKWGISVSLDGAQQFPVSETVMEFLANKLEFYRELNSSSEVEGFRLDCRYLELPNIEPWLDIYRLTTFSQGKTRSLIAMPCYVGEPSSDSHPQTFYPEPDDWKQRFRDATAREVAFFTAANPAFAGNIEAMLWIPCFWRGAKEFETVRVPIQATT